MTEKTKKALKSAGIGLIFLVVGIPTYLMACYGYISSVAESIPHGTSRVMVNGRMFGFWKSKVENIEKEGCAYCGGPGDNPNATAYRYVFIPCPILRCYMWFDQQDRLISIGPDYE